MCGMVVCVWSVCGLWCLCLGRLLFVLVSGVVCVRVCVVYVCLCLCV